MASSLKRSDIAPEDGVIKFDCKQLSEQTPDLSIVHELNVWRTKLHELGLIGVTPEGIGYGNVSRRVNDGTFIISASATGHLPVLTTDQYAIVESFNLKNNTLRFHGKLKASSESLSHATLYAHNPTIRYILHIHSRVMWARFLNKLSTTDSAIPYGTPQMAIALADISEGLAPGQAHAVVMGGHEDGVIAFGEDLDSVGKLLLDLFSQV